MEEKVGIEALEKVVDAVGEGVNVGYKIIVEKSGLLSAFSLADELSGLSSLKKGSVIESIKDLSAEEGASLKARFKAKVVLSDKMTEQKIEALADNLEETVSMVFDMVSMYHQVKALLDKWQASLAV